MSKCQDPLNVLFKPCFASDECGQGALSEDTFPFLTSKDEKEPTYWEIFALERWWWQVLLSGLATVFLVLDPFDIVPTPFDTTIPDYISSVAIGTYLFAAFSFLSGVGTEQAAEFRNMINAVTSFAHDLAGGITTARANRLFSTKFTIKIWNNDCVGEGSVAEVPGNVLICYIAALLQSSIYGTTRFLSEDGINIDLLPLQFTPLYNEVKRYTSPRNGDELSTMMEMALRYVQCLVDEDIVTPQVWAGARANVGDFNTAIGNLAIAKEIRVNKYSNRFLGYLIIFTTPFIPLVTDYEDFTKIILGFLISFVLFYTLALRTAESEITDVDNPLAGIRLKDEDDPGAYAAVVATTKTADLATTERTVSVGAQVALVVQRRYRATYV